MSIPYNCGASAAAAEIKEFIDRKIMEHSTDPDILKVLQEIKTKTNEIIRTADSGWY